MGFVCQKEGKTDKKYKLPILSEFMKLEKEMEKKNIEIQPLFDTKKVKKLTLSCRESLSNSNQFDNYELQEGEKILIKCYETCASLNMKIYGGPLYSKDTPICKAAFHSGKLPLNAGLVVMNIKKGIRNYLSVKNENRNIQSFSKAYSPLSIIFEEYIEDDPIVIKKGSKVEFYNEGLWKKAFIESFSTTKNGQFLKLKLDGENSISTEVKYPNPNIAPCGSHSKNRVCKGSIKNYISDRPIKIRFSPPNFPNGGDFIPDIGEVYGINGKSYGWSRTMKDSIFTYEGGNKPELQTLVVWPPSPTSKFCNRPNPQTICEPVTYAIWVGKGKFKVNLFIGDIKHDIKADFTINGKVILKNEKIIKGELRIFVTEIDSLNEFILITSECIEDCNNAQSKLNAIEIELITDIKKENKAKNNEKKLDCGEAYTGGRCEIGTDVTHCLFDDKFSKSASFCSGENALMKIPDDYKCKTQKMKYKCVKIKYTNEDECKNYCPKKCQEMKCLY
jgi:hypothetical protein